MSSHGAGARQRDLKKQELQLKKRAERESSLSYNLTPEAAFKIITKRIAWLEDKIAWSKANGKPAHFLEREIEAMYWMMDKVKELSEKLLEKQDEVRSLRESEFSSAWRNNSKEPTENLLIQSQGVHQWK